jgi:hypothetical protein
MGDRNGLHGPSPLVKHHSTTNLSGANGLAANAFRAFLPRLKMGHIAARHAQSEWLQSTPVMVMRVLVCPRGNTGQV